MPSSLIFTSLVVLWLLILVPAVARHQQEVARPSGALLAGRVLARPRRRGERHPSDEGDTVDDSVDDGGARTVGTRPDEVRVPAARTGSHRGGTTVSVPAQAQRGGGPVVDDAAGDDVDDRGDLDDADRGDLDDADRDADRDTGPDADVDGEPPDDLDADDRRWERPPPRYRPGRGGFDPQADAETARRRYAFRQRMVLALLVCALVTAVVAATVARVVWWAHGAVDLVLVAYLVHLRRQVREEAAIRERRAARMAGTRRTSAAEDRDLDEWARRGREVTRRPPPPAGSSAGRRPREAAEPGAEEDDPAADGLVDELGDGLAEDGDTARVRGVGEPVGLLPARRRGTGDDTAEPESALPRLRPAPPPPLPPGTSLVTVDDDELDLHDLGSARGSHRRAAGQ